MAKYQISQEQIAQANWVSETLTDSIDNGNGKLNIMGSSSASVYIYDKNDDDKRLAVGVQRAKSGVHVVEVTPEEWEDRGYGYGWFQSGPCLNPNIVEIV